MKFSSFREKPPVQLAEIETHTIESKAASASGRLAEIREQYTNRLAKGDMSENEADLFRKRMNSEALEAVKEYGTVSLLTEEEKGLGLEGKVFQVSLKDNGYGVVFSPEGKKIVFNRNYDNNSEVENPLFGLRDNYNSIEGFFIDNGYEFTTLTAEQEKVIQEANRQEFIKERIKTDIVESLTVDFDKKDEEDKEYTKKIAEAVRRSIDTAVYCDFVPTEMEKSVQDTFHADDIRHITLPMYRDGRNDSPDNKLRRDYDALFVNGAVAVLPRELFSQALGKTFSLAEDFGGQGSHFKGEDGQSHEELQYPFLTRTMGIDTMYSGTEKKGGDKNGIAIKLADYLRAKLKQIENTKSGERL
ncbi:MAG: hypothetical protein WCT26_04575 [Candidatus Buchananbacteria bacterium]|jgi:hypothetical protein